MSASTAAASTPAPAAAPAAAAAAAATTNATGSKKPTCGAMALLDKYSTLNANIEETRTRTASINAELDSVRSDIETVLDERRSMAERTGEARDEESTEFSAARLGEAAGRLDGLDRDRAEAVRDADLAGRELDSARRYADDGREAFLDRCREFRTACKRIRLAASASATASSSFAPSSSSGGLLSSSVSDEEEDDYGYSHQVGSGDGKDKTRANASVDVEMQEAEANAKDNLDARNIAKEGLDDAAVDRDGAAKRSDDRTRRLEQQRAQLDRVRSDVEEMERELAVLEQETKEARDIGDGLAKAASRRKNAAQNPTGRSSFSNSFNPPPDVAADSGSSDYTPPTARRSTLVTPSTYASGASASGGSAATSRPMNNPYKSGRQGSSSNGAPAPPHAGNGQGYGSNSGVRGAGGRGMNSLERQHPHRAGGRIRVDRRFSTALEIISGHDADADALMPDDGPDHSAGLSHPRADGAGTASRRRTLEEWNARATSLLEDDDDDDDDDILSFVAFGKK